MKASGNLYLGIIAFCTVAASVLYSATLIPAVQPLSVSYSSDSMAEEASLAAAVLPIPSSYSESLVNINHAGITELDTLPGIGPVLAQAIVDYREMNGRFETVADLLNVEGIGEKTLEKLLPYITSE